MFPNHTKDISTHHNKVNIQYTQTTHAEATLLLVNQIVLEILYLKNIILLIN